jgi:hypothetical protein
MERKWEGMKRKYQLDPVLNASGFFLRKEAIVEWVVVDECPYANHSYAHTLNNAPADSSPSIAFRGHRVQAFHL